MTAPRIVAPNDEAIEEAGDLLSRGFVVGLPTETVYGLAARTFDERAIARVYELKGRPANNPLIAHVASIDAAATLAEEWSEAAEALARAFWPGPLSLVLGRAEHVPPAATGGRDSIAIRMPSHPVAIRLLEHVGEPLSAPSANRSGAVSPTTAQHVAAEFATEDVLILDGGACDVGLESAVVDVRVPGQIRLLRPGSIRIEAMEAAVGRVEVVSEVVQGDAPGTSLKHYAPSTPVVLVDSFDALTERDAVICFAFTPPKDVRQSFSLGTDPETVARFLYDALRTADTCGAKRILIERVPAQGEWAAIADRLRRASS